MRTRSVFARIIASSLALAFACAAIAPSPVALALAPPTVAQLRPTALDGTSFSPRVGSRGSVNVRALAAHGMTPRRAPVSLPYHTRPGSASSPVAPRVAGPPAPVQATVTARPAAAQPGFQGLAAASGPSTNVDPPDPWVGVGPDHVAQVVNTSLRITDRSGTAATTDVSLADFFGISGRAVPTYNSDPRITYDALHGRWIATEVEWDCSPSASSPAATYGHGYIDVRISQTSDPTGGWSGFYFAFNDYLPDYPGLGTSSDKLALTANMFAMTQANCLAHMTHAGADVIVVDWTAALHTGGPSIADGYPFGTDYYTPRAAVSAPATSAPLRIVMQKTVNGSAHVDYVTISGLVGTTHATTGTEVDLTAANVIAPFVDPAPPQQPGGNVTTAIDSRPTDAIWQNDKLTFVSTQACTPSGDSLARDCVRVAQLNTATATPSLVQDFLIAANGQDSYMGGIGVSGNGGLFVAWTRSSATAGDYPSSYAAYQLPGDPANSISSPELLAAGQANHTAGRWGDYVGVAQDPQDPNAVWQGNEYASSDGLWGTFVSQIKTGSGSTYVPLPPARILDTRSGIGLSGVFSDSVPRTFAVAGHGGVPANAVAVTGNLTVTQQTGGGFVALTVSPTSTPPTSTLNFPVADNRANNVTIPLSTTGSLSAVYKATAGKTTQLIFDVTGYFLADATAATYATLTPTRILDTRTASRVGPYGTPFTANVPRELPVWGQGGVPSSATAVTGNLTVTAQTSGGYLTISNLSTATPTTSTLNFPVGDTRANGVSVALTAAGSLWIVYKAPTGKTAQVIFDVTGYYVPGTSGLRFFPLNPGRRLDGRPGINLGLPGTFSANLSRQLDVDGHLGVPLGAAAITGNLTVTGQTTTGFAAMTPDPNNTPSTSTLNFPVGDNRANGVTTPLNGTGYTSLVYKATSGTTYLILDISGYFN